MSMPLLHNLDPQTLERYQQLRAHLQKLGSVAVAYSGGVDSTLLATVAHDVLGTQMLAVTSAGHVVPQRDLDRTRVFCQERNIAHVIVPFDELGVPGFVENAPDRCYHCKKALFSQMLHVVQERGIATLVDGSNKDDEGDYRPGIRALEELGIGSPLRTVGLTKAQIRELSRALNLPTWNLPSAACLASRIAYGDPIDAVKLRRVEHAEELLHELGLSQVRVRAHGSDAKLARIEVPADHLELLVQPEMRTRVTTRLHELGFAYVSLDLDGFRSGAMNEVLS